MSYHQSHATLEFGEDHVTVRNRSGRVSWAKVVYAERKGNRVTYALLDRVVHDRYTGYGDYSMTGCLATEIRLMLDGDAELKPEIELQGVSKIEAQMILDAIRDRAPDEWLGHRAREQVVRGLIFGIVDDDTRTDWLFEQIVRHERRIATTIEPYAPAIAERSDA